MPNQAIECQTINYYFTDILKKKEQNCSDHKVYDEKAIYEFNKSGLHF